MEPKSVRTCFPTITPRADFPRIGQVFLFDWTFYPRKYCPVGQNFLGKCVPGHIFLWTDFPTTPSHI